ncbi:translational GTPase TypA [Coxiella burnetii]|uniref:Large ribosomal subunit assembly factor BipA n=1 Tax=Coxiella burnetii (strain RSA 493 / Nine Mile phase I) TaxID=227377 RepID=Q83D58_COXBU|nr:translational GTPase TypA [Coxiella burnetii]NP_819901.1 GTP-binding protein [Coxiella burnetii RSA 493]AAO90415.1 GTP-binding protein [Coxiella burnetii RSA 493]ABX78720.1 GTP-binding protein TypA/BipA [Coxiella burnetii RSA 331]AML49184.1 GTP-binding protein TypA [Coxiella burnetii]AML55119.1 GTP-binding protein TypA [Coxiella burnetii]ARI65717.1 translational GTPase TypA [Coxiella burnetii]
MIENIRNIAIIAHVDHGKTTLVDQLLQQSGTLNERAAPVERMMDSNILERERGITILAKNTAIRWRNYRINIVDTPGHADFGGEVERILSMVDSVLLLVDAVEGPMPQTRFVTRKAFSWGLKPIVVVNKIDRPGARPDWVVEQVFDLFVSLDATDAQLDFPVVYASALKGYATLDLSHPSTDMTPLFETIVSKVVPPQVDLNGPFQMQISSLDYSSYVGAIGIGRIQRGTIRRNTPVIIIDREGKRRSGRVLQLLGFLGLQRVDIETAEAGDIVAVTGIENLRISDTLCDPQQVEALPPLTVDEPTVSMTFQVNNSPFAGREGKFLTSRQIKERLEKELIANVALRVAAGADADKFIVSGRGELHLSILIENMRREGYEFSVSRPEVIKKMVDDIECEPFENLVLDIDEEHQGDIIQNLAKRKGDLKNMMPGGKGRVRLDYLIPTRGLIGFHSHFLTLTSGSGVMYHVFDHYAPLIEESLQTRHRGVLISNSQGVATAYALWNLQSRGNLFIGPQQAVYEGMIVGQHSRDNDLVVNVCREKQLTNIRAAGSDENIILTPPIKFSLEQALQFIADDELVEITPAAIRLRKKLLKEHERRRAER